MGDAVSALRYISDEDKAKLLRAGTREIAGAMFNGWIQQDPNGAGQALISGKFKDVFNEEEVDGLLDGVKRQQEIQTIVQRQKESSATLRLSDVHSRYSKAMHDAEDTGTFRAALISALTRRTIPPVRRRSSLGRC